MKTKDCMECHRPCHPDGFKCSVCQDIVCSQDCLNEHMGLYHMRPEGQKISTSDTEGLSPIEVHDKIRDEVHKTKYFRGTITDVAKRRVALEGTPMPKDLPSLKEPENEQVKIIKGES